MAGFKLTRAAETDLQEINDYLVRDSVDVALHVLARIEQALDELAGMPGLGHRREDLTAEDFRFWSVFNYLIVYDPASKPARDRARAARSQGRERRAGHLVALVVTRADTASPLGRVLLVV